MLDVLLGPESTFCFSNIKDNSKKTIPTIRDHKHKMTWDDIERYQIYIS